MSKKSQSVSIDYGRRSIDLILDPAVADWEIIQPQLSSPLSDFRTAFQKSVANPVASKPLRQIVTPKNRLLIVTSDNTRPVPNRELIPAIMEYCRLQNSEVTILVGTGTHRAPSEADLLQMFGEDLMARCRVICHDAADIENLEFLGVGHGGIPVFLNRVYLEADRRLVIGYIEPHFFAGFSGGAKGICPAICGLETIDSFHSFEIIGDPTSDYGEIEINREQNAAREVGAMAPPDFMINVTLNVNKEITGIYSGDYIEAHRIGAARSRLESMYEVSRYFDAVITSNSGYPLDQNLYQTVKGIVTASRIVKPGGKIIAVSECSKGIPGDGNFARIMGMERNSDKLLAMISENSFKVTDRWQVQKLALVLKKAEVYLYSALSRAETESCQLKKIDTVEGIISTALCGLTNRAAIAVLPNGPVAIPYVRETGEKITG